MTDKRNKRTKPARRPRQKNLLGVDQVLTRTLAQYGIEEKLTRYRFVLHWDEIVGPEIAKRTRPECVRGDSLVVRVSDSAWAQELSFQKHVILSRLSKFLERGHVVRDIKFYVSGDIAA